MRNGILFFLGMDRVRMLARCVVLPAFFLMTSSQFGTIFYFLGIAFFVLSAFLCFLPTPTDKKLQIVITDFQNELKEQTLRAAVAKNEELMLIINGYRKRGKMLLKRQIVKDMVYPHLASLSLYCKDKNYTLVLGTKSLLSPSPAVYTKLQITPNTLVFHNETDDESEKVIEVTVHAPELPNDLVIYVKNDYHYRDFLAALQNYISLSNQ